MKTQYLTLYQRPSSSPTQSLSYTILLACYGDMEAYKKGLLATLQSLVNLPKTVGIVILYTRENQNLDQDILNSLNYFSNISILSLQSPIFSYASLFNLGLTLFPSSYYLFGWPGSLFPAELPNSLRNIKNNESVYCFPQRNFTQIPLKLNMSLLYSWTQYTPTLPLSHIIVSKEAIEAIGLMDESPLVEGYFDWEWILRLSRIYLFTILRETTTLGVPLLDLKEYHPLLPSYSVVHRYILRNKVLPFTKTNPLNNEEVSFLKDLKSEDLNQLISLFNVRNLPEYSNLCLQCMKKNGAIKISILGGFWEYHHNQLCFLNYLELLYGQNFATYELFLDCITTPEQISGSDLVIFTRCRNPRILPILQYCKMNNIPTVYMLDDNWLSIAKDYPNIYGHLFIPGDPQYDTFMKAIGRCNYLLTYNRVLYEDFKKYNPNPLLFPLNINLSFYESPTPTHQKEDELIIGYTGSLRHEDTAFLALSKVVKKHPNCKVLLMGTLSNSQLRLFSPSQIISQPYLPYPQYTQYLLTIKPDILIAPLVNNHSSNSKCPNKYLEISAFGAAGIYSKVYPYTEVITDKINGVFAEDETTNSWESALEMLIEDPSLRESIKRNSLKDLRQTYDTTKVLPAFTKLIQKFVKGE